MTFGGKSAMATRRWCRVSKAPRCPCLPPVESSLKDVHWPARSPPTDLLVPGCAGVAAQRGIDVHPGVADRHELVQTGGVDGGRGDRPRLNPAIGSPQKTP